MLIRKLVIQHPANLLTQPDSTTTLRIDGQHTHLRPIPTGCQCPFPRIEPRPSAARLVEVHLHGTRGGFVGAGRVPRERPGVVECDGLEKGRLRGERRLKGVSRQFIERMRDQREEIRWRVVWLVSGRETIDHVLLAPSES